MTLTEQQFAAQIVGPSGLATILGWLAAHFRPAQTARGWRTPVSGELGKGWPDWVLVHPARHRLLVRELKTDAGRVSPEQAWVLEQLRAGGVDADIWRPVDMESGRIEAELRA